MAAHPDPEPRGTAAVLDSVRNRTVTIRDTEVDLAKDVVAWAELNTVTTPADAATISDGRVDTGVPIAGAGAPLVSEFALMELCAVLGRSTASGREYVGKVLEVAHRLPDLWAELVEGRVPVWRALKIADHTRLLSPEAAGFVDHHLAKFAAGCTWAQVDRLVAEALARFDPDTAEQRRLDAADRRHFDIDTDQVTYDGTAHIEGELDLADALDLDDAIARRAHELGELGCEESLDVRRSMAAGDLAREAAQPLIAESVDLCEGAQRPMHRCADSAPPPPTSRRQAGRKVELFVHLTDTALHGVTGGEVARCDNTQTPISPEQVREWCRTAGTITVRPVIDLTGHEPIDAYEIPDRRSR